jgi:CHAD domain-containing protein
VAKAWPRSLLLAADDPIGTAGSAVLRFHLRALEREREAARSGDVAAVHALRVATRRLRATLRLFEPALPATARQLGEELASVGRTIGAVRDLDVLEGAISAASTDVSRALRPGLGTVLHELRARRRTAHRALVDALDGPRLRALVARLGTVTGSRRDPLGAVVVELVRPLMRSVRRAGRDLDEDATPEKFHRLRVRVKRLRYALETLGGLGGRPLRQMVRRLEALQDVLGAQQDAVTQTTWLRELAGDAGADGPTILAVGALLQVLDRRARRMRRKFPRVWARCDRRRLRRQLVRALERRARHRRQRVRLVAATG